MPEQAGRPSADRRAAARLTSDLGSNGTGDHREFSDGHAKHLASDGRRTIVIRGQVADRYSPRPRPPRVGGISRPYVRSRTPPERVALWAVLLGFALVLAAIVSTRI